MGNSRGRQGGAGRWRRLAAALALVVLVFAAWRFACPRLAEYGGERLAAVLAARTGLRATVKGPEIFLVPPSVRVSKIVLGSAGAAALVVSDVSVVLQVGRSLESRRAALRVGIGSVDADTRNWTPRQPRAHTPPASSSRKLPMAVGIVRVGKMHVLAGAGGSAYDITVSGVKLEATTARGWLGEPGGVLLELQGGGAVVRREDRALRVARLAIEAELRAAQVRLHRAHIESDAGFVDATGAAGGGVSFQGEVVLGQLAAIGVIPGPVRGHAVVSGRARGGLRAPRVEVSVSMSRPAYGNLSADSLAARGRYEDGRLRVDDLTIAKNNTDMHGAGSVLLRAPYHVEAAAAVPGLDLRALGGAMRMPGIAGRGEMRLHFKGSLRPLSLRGEAEAGAIAVDARATGGADLNVGADVHFRVREDSATADGQVRLGNTGKGILSISLRKWEQLEGEALIEVGDAGELGALFPAVGGGTLVLAGGMQGELRQPLWDGEIRARDLVISGVLIDKVEGGFGLSRQALVVKDLSVDAVGGRIRADGRLALGRGGAYEGQAALEHIDLESAWAVAHGLDVSLPRVEGVLDGSVSGRSGPDAVALAAQVNVAPCAIAGERFASLSGDVSAAAGEWIGHVRIRGWHDEWLRVDATRPSSSDVSVSLSSSPWGLAAFHYLRRAVGQVNGTAILTARFAGPVAGLQGEAQLQLQNVAVNGEKIGALVTRGSSVGDGWLVALESAGGELRVVSEVRREAGYPFTLQADLAAWNLGPLLARAADLAVVADGSIRIDGELSNLRQTASGELRLRRLRLARGEYALEAVPPVVVRGTAGRFAVESFRLRNETSALNIKGRLATSGDIVADVDANAAAEIIEFVVPRVTSARGQLAVTARIRRTAAGKWYLHGNGQVEDLALDMGLPFAITETKGRFALNGSRIEVSGVAGKLGGGEYAVSGLIDIERGPALDWQLIGVSSGLLEGIEDEISGVGRIRGTWAAPEVSGDLTILNALYDRPIALVEMIPWLRRRVAPRAAAPRARILLDLDVVAPSSIFVDTNFAQAEFQADLHVGGTAAAPQLAGSIEAIDGGVMFGKQTFTLTEGLIGFANSPKVDPELRFAATTEVQTTDTEYAITAQLTGSLKDYRLALSADDSGLSPTDIVSLLMLGKTAAQLQSEGGGVSGGDIVALAPIVYGGQTEAAMARVLAVDRIEIQPSFSRTTGSFSPLIRVGKDLSDSLSAVVTSTFGVEAKRTVALEYRLTPEILLGGSWENRTESSQGAFGGEIKFRHRFYRFPRLSLLPGARGAAAD